MLLSTPALVKTLPVSALKVLFVAKQSMFHPCGESTKLSHFSQSAYVQPFNAGLPMHSSYHLFRRGSPHSAMLNQLQNASRTNSSTPQKGLRIHTLSRFVVPTLNFYYSRVATLLTEKRRTRACCQVKSVKVRFPRRVQFSHASLPPHIFVTPLSHPGLHPHVSMYRPRACLTAMCVRFCRQTRNYVSKCSSLKFLWSID
jgi:hypothetical protein